MQKELYIGRNRNAERENDEQVDRKINRVINGQKDEENRVINRQKDKDNLVVTCIDKG